MNGDEGSYQLSHIYDRLFAATSGGKQKLSRPFWGRQQFSSKILRLYFDKVLLVYCISTYAFIHRCVYVGKIPVITITLCVTFYTASVRVCVFERGLFFELCCKKWHSQMSILLLLNVLWTSSIWACQLSNLSISSTSVYMIWCWNTVGLLVRAAAVDRWCQYASNYNVNYIN